jgi:hypothetical protein
MAIKCNCLIVDLSHTGLIPRLLMIRLHYLEPLFDLSEPHLHSPVLLFEKLNVLPHPLGLSNDLHVLILLFLDCTVKLNDLGFRSLHIFFVLVLEFHYFSD